MQAFISHTGQVLPLDRANVDTDALLPKQFLRSIRRTGFGPHLFDDWRYLDPHVDGEDVALRRPNPEFILNRPKFQGATVLVAGANLGCGSSREHAPWALRDYGFRCLLAPSFADIFFNNCMKNGLLPVVLDAASIESILAQALSSPAFEITDDLPAQTVHLPDGAIQSFDIEPSSKESLLHGWDEIGQTLRFADEIRAYEIRQEHSRPWLF